MTETILQGIAHPHPPELTISSQPYRKRARIACINCRRRKARCDFDDEGNPDSPCRRCREENTSCEVPTFDKRGGYANVLAGKERRERVASFRTTTTPEDSVLRNELFTAKDAIEILKRASSEKLNASDIAVESPPESLNTEDYLASGLNAGVETLSRRAHSIHEAPIVLDGILPAEEVPRLVAFFFAEIVPFYRSYIPREYEDLSVIAGEPAMLAVICTIGARHRYDDEADCELHETLWAYCQSTISRLMWECPDDQVRSLVFSVIVLSEWFPAALLINRNSSSDPLDRHTRICWPLIGQAVRLSRYVGLLDRDIQLYIALHFCDHLLACRLGQQPMFDYLVDSEFPQYSMEQLPMADKARLDIVRLLHLANRSLYTSRSAVRRMVMKGQHITIFNLLYPQVQKWRTDYSDIVKCNTWEDRTIMFEFSHCELYLFSLFPIPAHNDSSTRWLLLSFEESNKFLEVAVCAAKFIIEHESSDDVPVEIRHAPIQWISRLVHASVFLAKTLLVKTVYSTRDKEQEIARLLKTASDILEKCPPNSHRRFCKPLRVISEQVLSRTRPQQRRKSRVSHGDQSRPRLESQRFTSPRSNSHSSTISSSSITHPSPSLPLVSNPIEIPSHDANGPKEAYDPGPSLEEMNQDDILELLLPGDILSRFGSSAPFFPSVPLDFP